MRRLLMILTVPLAASLAACTTPPVTRGSHPAPPQPPPGHEVTSATVPQPGTTSQRTVVPPVTSAPRTTAPTDRGYPFCATADAALAYLVGVVWADGGIAGDTAHIRLDSRARADAVEAAGRCAGVSVISTRDGDLWNIRFPGVGRADVNHAGTPPMLAWDSSAGFETTKAFLAGVIEAEGGRTSGLVVDDTHDEHLDAVPPLLDRVGIRWYQQGNKVYAAREDWPAFAGFPFAVYDRVPGYGITWR